MSKSVALTIGTARERLVNHDTREMSDCNYASFSSLGRLSDYMKMVAQATLLHYMHRVGDFRSNRTVGVAGDELADGPYSNAAHDTTQFATWKVMKFSFLGQSMGGNADTNAFQIAEGTLESMTATLTTQFLFEIGQGRRLAQVAVFREPDNCVLCDINAGRNVVEVSSSAHLKVQNVTPGQGSTGDDKLGINSNPIDGLVYTFKNHVPLFKQGYLVGKTEGNRIALDRISEQYVNSAGGHNIVDFASIGNEYNMPPINPTTIFRNVAGKSKCYLPPGGHKLFKQYEHYRGPLNSFFDRYFRPSGTAPHLTPPGGSCVLIGLKPSLRNATTGQVVKLEKEFNYMYCARMSKCKITSLPMRTVIN